MNTAAGLGYNNDYCIIFQVCMGDIPCFTYNE